MWSQMIETLLYHQFVEMVKFCPKGQFDTGYANCRNNVDTGCANCRNNNVTGCANCRMIK